MVTISQACPPIGNLYTSAICPFPPWTASRFCIPQTSADCVRETWSLIGKHDRRRPDLLLLFSRDYLLYPLKPRRQDSPRPSSHPTVPPSTTETAFHSYHTITSRLRSLRSSTSAHSPTTQEAFALERPICKAGKAGDEGERQTCAGVGACYLLLEYPFLLKVDHSRYESIPTLLAYLGRFRHTFEKVDDKWYARWPTNNVQTGARSRWPCRKSS